MEIKGLKLSVTNCYLVGSGKPYLLVDTGYVEDWDRLCKRLNEAGVGWRDIEAILLTHHHDDHCGCLQKALGENPQMRIVLSEQGKRFLSTGKNDSTWSRPINRRVQLFITLLSLFDQRWRTHSFPAYQTRASDILVSGETHLRDIGIGLDGRIIETPGHSLDSISVLFEDGDCIVGDAASNFPAFLGTKYCVILIEDLETYYTSWRKLISAGARQIFPAHGKPFPVERLEQNLGKNRRAQMAS